MCGIKPRESFDIRSSSQTPKRTKRSGRRTTFSCTYFGQTAAITSITIQVKGYTTAIKWAKKFADNGHAFRYRYLDDVWDIVAADTSYRYSNAEWFKKKKNKAVER
ncbi:hypothetical protein E4U44_008482 [Claviceps purpurea]|nr:hypothetical protein E4U44_008482 [Claviceps purpurea]